MNLSKPWETVKDMEAWHAAVHEIAKSQTWLSDWTTISNNYYSFRKYTELNTVDHLIWGKEFYT